MRLSAGRSYLSDHYARGRQDWQLPFQIAGTNERLEEQLSVHARIAKFQPRCRGKTRGHCTPHLWPPLARMMVVDFPGAGLEIETYQGAVPLLASVLRMSRSSDRTRTFAHKLQRYR